MPPAAPKPLPPKVLVDLNKYRRPLIREHEIESGQVGAGATAKCLHRSNSMPLLVGRQGMVNAPAAADVIVKAAAANPKIADGELPVDHHPEIPATVLHPALQQSRLILRQPGKSDILNSWGADSARYGT